jgi:hypothetical protein
MAWFVCDTDIAPHRQLAIGLFGVTRGSLTTDTSRLPTNTGHQWSSQDLEIGDTMASAEREPIWGPGALPPVGSRGKPLVRGSGGFAPEADDSLILKNKFSELRMHLRHSYAASNK